MGVLMRWRTCTAQEAMGTPAGFQGWILSRAGARRSCPAKWHPPPSHCLPLSVQPRAGPLCYMAALVLHINAITMGTDPLPNGLAGRVWGALWAYACTSGADSNVRKLWNAQLRNLCRIYPCLIQHCLGLHAAVPVAARQCRVGT